MNNLPENGRGEMVRDMFGRIAPRYDLMNRLMTGGMDVRWRKIAIQHAELYPGARVLDLGAGTGDLAREALAQQPGSRVVAADFTLGMMRAGIASRLNSGIAWSAADALHLPFADAGFDALVSGFLMRNVVDLQLALREQFRVLKRGGRLVALDTTRPRAGLLTPLIRFHMHTVIPLLGWVLTGQRDAYTYLPETTAGFLRAEELVARLAAVGFKEINYQIFGFGTVAIHWARKR